MKRSSSSILWLALTIAGAALLAGPARAQLAPAQTLTLSGEWNSVWLEVEPVYAVGDTVRGNPDVVLAAGDSRIGLPKAPRDVFTDPAITAVATPKILAGLAEFFGDDPANAGTFNQEGWEQWNRTDSLGVNNLSMVFGNRPYLIQVTTGATLNLTGKARFFRPTWTPDRFNLVGFGLEGTPTFAAFFSPSGGKHLLVEPATQTPQPARTRMFRLTTGGSWVAVNASDTMKSGEAYWIFSKGPSTYMGPVAIDFTHSMTGRLNFGGPGDAVPTGTGVDVLELDLEELVFTNLAAASATPTLELKTADPGPGSLALQVVIAAPASLGYTRGSQIGSASLGLTIDLQQSKALTIGARRTGTFGPGGRTDLYRLTTGAGASFWLPITALDSDLPADVTAPTTVANPVTGLWVGEVIVDAATSIVEDGSPVRPAAGSVPMRILLHSDTGGQVRLLSQVTIMQSRTADPAVAPVPVLVVDPARIPFFEGIKERNGKRVGLRLEAVAYDMPRKTGDTYELTLPLTGALVAGQTVRTSPGALILDATHRSNPFRHAFHQNHTSGPLITRELAITFDSSQAIAGRLRGAYTETITGLTKTNLVLTGRVELHLVSGVETLEPSE